MSGPSILWRGLALGAGTPFKVTSIEGWEDLVGVDSEDQPRTRGDGEFDSELWGQARVVTIEGHFVSRDAAPALVAALQAVTGIRNTVDALQITNLDRTLTAFGRIRRRSLPTGMTLNVGLQRYTLQWRCSDPLRYGPQQNPSTGLPTSGTGLTYPLSYPLDYGTPGNPGQIVLDNTTGTADASMLLTVNGSLPLGFEVSSAGQRLTYPVAVPAGQPVVMDTAVGTVKVEGTADRRINLTNADWLRVPAGQAATLQFTSLGGTYDPAATLSAQFRPASW